MINLLSSTARSVSSDFTETRRKRGESNGAWLARQLASLRSVGASEPMTHVLLIGGVDDVAFRLRVAQSHLRHDLRPSHWSHAALVDDVDAESDATALPLLEISLDPPDGFGFPAPTNGIQRGTFATYDDPARFPNVAVLSLPVPVAHWRQPRGDERSTIDLYQAQRAVLDAPDLIVSWLAFVWGVGRAGNPVLDGKGIPAAAMIETVLNSVGFDLSPGIGTRVSCPESFWQAAKWWERYYEGQQLTQAIRGRYVVTDRLGDPSG